MFTSEEEITFSAHPSSTSSSSLLCYLHRSERSRTSHRPPPLRSGGKFRLRNIHRLPKKRPPENSCTDESFMAFSTPGKRFSQSSANSHGKRSKVCVFLNGTVEIFISANAPRTRENSFRFRRRLRRNRRERHGVEIREKLDAKSAYFLPFRGRVDCSGLTDNGRGQAGRSPDSRESRVHLPTDEYVQQIASRNEQRLFQSSDANSAYYIIIRNFPCSIH